MWRTRMLRLAGLRPPASGLQVRRFRVRASGALAVVLGALSLAGCRQDMHQAPRFDPLEQNEMFADHRAARPLVEGTVPRGFLREDKAFYSGKLPDGTLMTTLPVKIDKALLLRGQDRFDVFCSPCHGRTGDGNGMVVQRGFKQPTSYHTDRLRAQPVGYFYDVMTNGFGTMQDYSAQVSPQDRWAIAAYIRALQLSRHAAVADVPADARGALDAGTAPPAGAAHAPGATTHE